MGFGLAVLGIGLGIGLLVIGAAYGIGMLAASAMEGIARQPEAAGDIRGTAIVLAALIEGFTFFALIVAIILGNYVSGIHDAKEGARAANDGIRPSITAPAEK